MNDSLYLVRSLTYKVGRKTSLSPDNNAAVLKGFLTLKTSSIGFMALKCTILASLIKLVEFLHFDLVFQCVTHEYK